MPTTKENTLYLPIKQVYFDQIVNGTKKEEYREIQPNTYKKYLDCDENGEPYYDDEVLTMDDLEFYADSLLFACKDDKFPFFFREDIKYLSLAVGYAKERDTAIVEVTDITPMISEDKNGNPMRFDIEDETQIRPSATGSHCFWLAVFHLGKVIEVHRKNR